jgi:hypothetical protein
VSDWQQVETPSVLIAAGMRWTKAFQRDVTGGGWLTCFVGPEPDIGWHLSISHNVMFNGQQRPGRYPTWDEITEARYRFVPDAVTMAMMLPPRAEYVNVHDTTFHLHQTHGPDPLSTMCRCGHDRHAHIYEEGACRPGFVCSAGCNEFESVGPR